MPADSGTAREDGTIIMYQWDEDTTNWVEITEE
jgi:hypothetical protein